jgi:hypothetical protein
MPPAGGTTTTTPPSTTGQQAAPSTDTTQAAQQNAPEAADTSEASAALGGTTIATGYIDPAKPMTQFRLRFDAAYDDNRPDRAEFFYAKCGCFANPALPPGVFDPKAPGPRLTETSVDYQDITAYLEVAASDRFSGFVEVPFRFLNPEQNENTSGIADMNAGFKFALVARDNQYFTFQFRTYIPTGDPGHGLGTDHVSLEPAFLYHQPLTCKLDLDAELRDWIPIGGTDFAGNVVRYRVGLSYRLIDGCHLRVQPVGEIVGWTVLDGKELAVSNPAGPLGVGLATQDATGDTIVNAKVGARFGFGPRDGDGLLSRSDLYLGYGRALTGEVWYKDIVRAEYRLRF